LDKDALQASRPLTYAAIEKALSMVTETQVAKYKVIFGSIWTF
jgi:hypothetical protein